MKPDPATEAILAPYRVAKDKKLDRKIGTTGTTFVADLQQERKQEMPIGDYIADAMLWRYESKGVQIAFTEAGGIRSSWPSAYVPNDPTLRRPAPGFQFGPPWDLVVGDVYSALPFGNTCVIRHITGSTLWQILENAVAKAPYADGRFLQVSGLAFTYRLGNPAGHRVQSVTLNSSAVTGADAGTLAVSRSDPTVYTVVTDNVTNEGNQGFAMLIENVESPTLEILADIVLEYLNANAVIAPPPAGRITQMP